MNKWLKDRQLGKIVKKETILENISKCPQFEYKGSIEFAPHHSQQLPGPLQWINDGHNLVALVYNRDTDGQNITIWKDPNIYAKEPIQSKIDLSGPLTNKIISSMIYNDSSAVLHGSTETHHINEDGFICNLSMETGRVESSLRNRLSHVTWAMCI